MTTTTPTPLDFGLPPAEATCLRLFHVRHIYPAAETAALPTSLNLSPWALGSPHSSIALCYATPGACGGMGPPLPIGMQLHIFSKDKDEFSIYVDPRVWRRGHGATILRAAHEHWHLNLWSQHYTAEGRALVLSFLNQNSFTTDVNLSGGCATNPRATQLSSSQLASQKRRCTDGNGFDSTK